jgi:hypothetical protein
MRELVMLGQSIPDSCLCLEASDKCHVERHSLRVMPPPRQIDFDPHHKCWLASSYSSIWRIPIHPQSSPTFVRDLVKHGSVRFDNNGKLWHVFSNVIHVYDSMNHSWTDKNNQRIVFPAGTDVMDIAPDHQGNVFAVILDAIWFCTIENGAVARVMLNFSPFMIDKIVYDTRRRGLFYLRDKQLHYLPIDHSKVQTQLKSS